MIDMVVNPDIGITLMEGIAAAGPAYIWLQPGSSSPAIIEAAENAGIQVIEACILVELRARPDLSPDS